MLSTVTDLQYNNCAVSSRDTSHIASPQTYSYRADYHADTRRADSHRVWRRYPTAIVLLDIVMTCNRAHERSVDSRSVMMLHVRAIVRN